MEFPRLVYKSPSQYVSVDTQEQMDKFHEEGWYASVPEALEGKRPIKALPPPPAPPRPSPPPPEETVAVYVDDIFIDDDDIPPTREELVAKAKELHIRVYKTTSDADLNAKIDAAIDERLKELTVKDAAIAAESAGG